MSETEARDSDGATPDETPDRAPEAAPDEGGDDQGPEPSWWHRSHPTFAGLVGFFTGVAYVIIVPGVYAALLVPRKTRRFAQFMFLGIISTVVVVAVTAAVVIWAMIRIDG